MNEMQNAISPVEPAKGSRDAYRLGRYLETICEWVELIGWFEATNPPEPWSWDFPFTAFGDSIDWSPSGLIMEIHDSLRTLAVLRAVDPGVLVEMHRHWDEVMEASAELAEYFRCRNRDGMYQGYWNVMHHLSILYELTWELFARQGGPLQDWEDLGDLLGKALKVHIDEDGHDFAPGIMTEFVALGQKLLPGSALDTVVGLYDPKAPYIGIPNREEPAGKLISAILDLDKRILDYLAEPVSAEPDLVFDDRKRTIIFLGTEISFDDLPPDSTGGIKLLRVLARHPGKPMSAKQLIKASDLAIGANQLYSYMSRFRGALRKIIDEKKVPSTIELMRDSTDANACFILANRTARTRAVIKETFYELALPPERVKYIAPT